MAAGNKLDKIRERLQSVAEAAARTETDLVASEDPGPKLRQKRVRLMNWILIGATAAVVGMVGWTTYAFYKSIMNVRQMPPSQNLGANSIFSAKQAQAKQAELLRRLGEAMHGHPLPSKLAESSDSDAKTSGTEPVVAPKP